MCIFCEFIEGKRKRHTNGLPFKILNETKHTISFFSIDFPEASDGHMLVIPKKHFESIEHVPQYILTDLISHVSLSSKVMKKNHDACNILLNNGKEAGQTVFHMHFHLIPRNEGDGIKIEDWQRKDIDESYFNKMIRAFRSDFKNLS